MRRREDHSWSADAALRTTQLKKRFLQIIQPRPRCQSFDSDNVRVSSLENGYEATIHQRAVYQHRTRATLAFATSLFCPGQAEPVPQCVQQSFHRIDV